MKKKREQEKSIKVKESTKKILDKLSKNDPSLDVTIRKMFEMDKKYPIRKQERELAADFVKLQEGLIESIEFTLKPKYQKAKMKRLKAEGKLKELEK